MAKTYALRGVEFKIQDNDRMKFCEDVRALYREVGRDVYGDLSDLVSRTIRMPRWLDNDLKDEAARDGGHPNHVNRIIVKAVRKRVRD